MGAEEVIWEKDTIPLRLRRNGCAQPESTRRHEKPTGDGTDRRPEQIR
jgi:hypothetical protein